MRIYDDLWILKVDHERERSSQDRVLLIDRDGYLTARSYLRIWSCCCIGISVEPWRAHIEPRSGFILAAPRLLRHSQVVVISFSHPCGSCCSRRFAWTSPLLRLAMWRCGCRCSVPNARFACRSFPC